MTTREEKLERALYDIYMQATRRNRASDLKRYLVTDLEIIEAKANKALTEKESS